MHLSSPILLGSLALVPFYVWLRLRQRRPPVVVVSSLMLWKAVAPPPRAVLARRQRLWNLALLLEALSFALVCLSLAQPYVMREASRPVHLVLAIDDSAGMAVNDRWKRAIARAKGLLDTLEAGDVVTLLWNRSELPRVPLARAREAIESSHPSPIEGDLEGLLARARAIAAGEPSAIARVLADRALPDAPELESFGGPADNAGIVAASVEGKQAFVSVAATSPRKVTVEVRDGERVLGHAEVAIEDERPTPAIIPVDATGPGSLQVRLAGQDDLSFDDEVDLESHPAATVRLESKGNSKLLLALSVQTGVKVVQGEGGKADLVVLDRVWNGALPNAPCVLIAPPADCRFRGAEVKGPIDGWESGDPLLASLVPDAVGLKKAHAFAQPSGWSEERVLARAGGKPILAVGRLRGLLLLYIGFDVSLEGGECTWAMHPHFPVFWNHVLTTLAGGRTGWTVTRGLLSLRETLCSGEPSAGGPIDIARTHVVSSRRFFTAEALIVAALGFAGAFLLARRANGCPPSSSSTTP